MERKKRKKERKRIDGCGELLKLVFAFNKVPRRTRSALRIGLEIRYFQLSKLGLVIRINPRRNEPRVFADQWTVNFSHSFAPFHNRFVNWSAAVLPPPPLFRPRLCKNRAQGMRWFTWWRRSAKMIDLDGRFESSLSLEVNRRRVKEVTSRWFTRVTRRVLSPFLRCPSHPFSGSGGNVD